MKTFQQPLVSVVLLSYDRPEFLERAIESVLAQIYTNIEFILVDNPSGQSDRIAAIASRHRSIRLIRNTENVGFAAGMNIGIRSATGRYVYLTEDDIVLDPDCVGAFVDFMEAHGSPVLATGILFNKTAGTVRSAGGHISLDAVMSLKLVAKTAQELELSPAPYPVSFIPGSMVFAGREALVKLGGFREDFFMYFEDTELCLRALKHGFSIVVVPTARAHHFEPGESKSSQVVAFHQQKNIFALYLLHAKKRVWPGFFLRYALLDLMRSALRDQSRFRLLLSALKAIGRLVPSLVRERRAPLSAEGI